MEFFTDVVALSRFQFAFTIFFHFLFVPLSIGLGLIMALTETRYYKTRSPEDKAASMLWLKIFTTTFAVGVASGITMEFAFGTNWATYSRFMGDIFGPPLAAEALFAFFLESVFLGVMIFGRGKVSPRFYMISAWLVWIGSALSALWILIANSWMQTPAGYEIVQTSAGEKAVLTDFWAAIFNPSTSARYFHTIDALLILGALLAISLAAWYIKKGKHEVFARNTLRLGAIVGLVTAVLMLPTAHDQAVVVAENQPMKLAAMEGQYEAEPAPLYLFGWVDTENERVIGPNIPGGTSFLATWDFEHVFPGLNDFPEEETSKIPVQLVFQAYHLMVALWGAIMAIVLVALWATFKGMKRRDGKGIPKLVLWILILGPLAPFLAIQSGWIVAEVGRQPWIVYGLLKVEDAISASVTSTELLITIGLFMIVYAVVFIAWLNLVRGYIRKGPVVEEEGEEGSGY